MAKEAIMIHDDGSSELVYAKDLTDADQNNKFICPGILDGGCLCGIDMALSNETDLVGRYFYARARNQIHGKGCPCARNREKSIVERLDQRGEGTTTQQLYDRFNRDERPKIKKPDNPPLYKDPDDLEDVYTPDNPTAESQNEYDRNTDKQIEIKQRGPRNPKEYIELISNLPTNAQYADRLVYDQILDERTIQGYRRFGTIPTERPLVVNTKKALPRDYDISLNSNQWLLQDYWGKGRNAFLLILNLDPEAKQKLWNLCDCKPAVRISILGIFRKHPTRPRTFVSDLVKSNMIVAAITNDV